MTAQSADGASQRDSLKGIVGVIVAVEALERDAEALGLTASAIQTDVELRLRTAGIRIFSKTDEAVAASRAMPILDVEVQTSHPPSLDGLYIVAVNVILYQSMRSTVTPDIVSGATWMRRPIFTVGRQNLDTVRKIVKDKLDEFINDYLTANPKRP